MRTLTQSLQQSICVLSLLAIVNMAQGQALEPLKIKDFAVWGGSAAPGTYNSSQGVFIGNIVAIEGNVGSNHLVDAKNLFSITGNVYSGNVVNVGNIGKITGNVYAAKTATNYTGYTIAADYKINFTGNLISNGKVYLKSLGGQNATSVTGKVSVPAPTATNYSGPAPTGGVNNNLAFPALPEMPTNIAFDNQAGTANVTATQTISPGKFKKLALNGNKIVTFNGPGNYIFDEVDNDVTANKLVFDFKNTTTGSINIFIIKNAKWGRLSVKTVNGNFPSRIYTEIHGNGSGNDGNAFNIIGPVSMPDNSYVWLGNIWAPNGGICFKSLNPFNSPHVLGALWSAKKVELDQNLRLVYQAAAVGTGPAYIAPYYPPPANGKVATTSNIIGAELTSISQNTGTITAIPDNEIFVLNGSGKVMIEVISKAANDATLKAQLIALGMSDTVNNGPHIYTITGFFPINRLTQLNTNTRIDYVRPLYPPISNTGQVTTQGDITMRSNNVRDRFGLDGSGVKIGVISDSYDAKQGAQTDVNEGDLPGVKSSGEANPNPNPVQVLQDLADGRGNDEGRAMLQIVHDVAPKAKLAFATGFVSAGQFAGAIRKLAAPTLPGGKCDVIVDDLTYITEPFQRDGIVAQAVNDAVAQGVTYFSSAGNFGNKSYEAVFSGVTNTTIIPGQIHKFGANATDIYQTINMKPGSYTIVLQWSDEFTSLGSALGVQTDMDLYLVNNAGYQLFGFNRSNLFGDPFEVCAFTVKEETNAKLMIVRASGTANVRFKYVIFRGEGTIMDFQSPTTSSIVGHPNATGAIAVGAMLYDNIQPYTPIWPGVASFSSRGGTATLQGTTFVTRNKPDLVGPNGVNTTVNLGGTPFNDGDTYPNFFGTSAAAPHVAAVGALIIQGRKKFNLQTTVTPATIRQQLVSSAGKFANLPGAFSYEGGYGYVQADSAIAQIANARPVISTLEAVVPGAQNGTQSFAVKMTGKYIASNAKINVNNVPYTTTVTVNAATGVGTAIATVPAIPIGLDPVFEVVNPAKSVSGLDGGRSEGLRFFSSSIKILVKAQNKSRKYGQQNPAFNEQVSVVIGSDTTDISQTSLTLASLKLDNLVYATNAETNSSPRSYGISIARATPLPANDPLLGQYTFVFQPGTLLVEKMPLRITPFEKVLRYGDDLTGITYNYELDQSGVLSPSLLEEVKAMHKQYLAGNGLIVMHGINPADTAVQSRIANMAGLASFQSVLNARKFVSANGALDGPVSNIPASQLADQRFIVDVDGQSLFNYAANPAQSQMLQGAPNQNARTLLGIKSLTSGNAKAATPNGSFTPMVNGQLLAMVNGQLQALVNGEQKAIVNGILIGVSDITFQNGQLLALVNNIWVSVTNAQLIVTVEGSPVTVDLSLANGQLQALVNGVPMTLVNGQLQALVNGQLLALVNGQLKALVNAQLTPLINGQLMAIVNGSLEPLNNGQLQAIVNGQLMVLENNELEVVKDLLFVNGQLQALVNGQLKALVNGQLKALVNGVVTDVPTNTFNLVNGQLQAIVNGQQVAYANGQLQALVNGQLKALVNGSAVSVQSVQQLANGQLKAIVNGVAIPIANGQLQALVNGQLLAMVNGQLMAIVNGEVTFVVFQNGQLKALVNGQLQALVNGQLKAIVNGELTTVNSYSIVNGQLQAIVNGETWVYPNGQLKAIVNGQLQPLVNNFNVSGTNNNANTVVVVDENDITLQSGDVGGMFSMNMVTGLEAGWQYMLPGAFVNENFDVTYVPGLLRITKKPLLLTAENKTKTAGEPNPSLTITYGDLAYDDTPASVVLPTVFPASTVSIDQLERRTTYTNVLLNGTSNVYYATPGESVTITGDYTETHFSAFVPGYITYCPGCITQNYFGMANDQYTGNVFDNCNDVSGTFGHVGALSRTFTVPTRPGVYYITQVSTWWNFCYQFGNVLQDQVPAEAIAVVIVNPVNGQISLNTTATDGSPAGTYPIVIGGGYFNPNYRITLQDGTLTIVDPSMSMRTSGNGNDARTAAGNTAKTVNDPKDGKTTQTAITEETTTITGIKTDLLYPNPASTVMRLQLKDDVQSANDIRLYDGVGKSTAAYSRKINNGLYEINVSGLTRGVYVIEAKTAAGIKTFKFIKM